jgi:hypothetical protein
VREENGVGGEWCQPELGDLFLAALLRPATIRATLAVIATPLRGPLAFGSLRWRDTDGKGVSLDGEIYS